MAPRRRGRETDAPIDFAGTKRCSACQRRQPLAEYDSADGPRAKCRRCLQRDRDRYHGLTPEPAPRGPGGRPFHRPRGFYAALEPIDGRGEPLRFRGVALPPDVIAVQVLRALRGPLPITEREVEVLQAWWRRRSVRGAGELLELSASAIRWHLGKVLERLKRADGEGAWCEAEERGAATDAALRSGQSDHAPG